MAELTIDIHDVAKTYRGKIEALRGVSMQVHPGEVFGLLGPNGAGKSTLVKILMTVIRPTRCTGTMLGSRVGHKPALARVGYLPEHHKFPSYLTGGQVLDFYGAMCGISKPDRRRRADELLDVVDMAKWKKNKVGSYSKGMRQRLGIAQALINDPDLVVLDEPTDGVDPVGRRDIRNVVKRLREQGKTVFINSHLLSELELVCDRVAILVKGLVVQQGTLDELTGSDQHYEIILEAPIPPTDRLDLGVDAGLISIEGQTIRIATTDVAQIQPVIAALVSRGLAIRSIRPMRPTLEDLFMQAVENDPGVGA